MEKSSLEEFGNRVKDVRKKLKLSQKEFGEAVQLSPSFISDIESGRSRAGYDFFYHVSRILNVNLYYLVFGIGSMFESASLTQAILPDSKPIGQQIENIGELTWYMEHSPLFKHTILGFSSKFLLDNLEIIEKDIAIKSKKGVEICVRI